jgi:hypothetical protein
MKDAELSFQYFEEIKNLLRTHNALFFEIGKQLKIFRDNKYYEYLGDGGYDSWHSFLGSGELGIGRSTAHAYIQLYEVYIEQYGFTREEMAEIPYDKLRMVLPHVNATNSRQEVEEWVEKAKVLSRSDLMIESNIILPTEKYTKVVKCDNCGGWKVENPCRCLTPKDNGV